MRLKTITINMYEVDLLYVILEHATKVRCKRDEDRKLQKKLEKLRKTFEVVEPGVYKLEVKL